MTGCDFRLQRLVAHAEEVAYNDPPSGTAEQLILNQHLSRLLRHNRLSAFQRFVQQVSLIASLSAEACLQTVHAPGSDTTDVKQKPLCNKDGEPGKINPAG